MNFYWERILWLRPCHMNDQNYAQEADLRGGCASRIPCLPTNITSSSGKGLEFMNADGMRAQSESMKDRIG